MTSWMKRSAHSNNSFTISVRVKPKSSRSCVLGLAQSGSEIEVALQSPPVDGAANAELVALFSKTLGVRKSDVEILRGDASRIKLLLVHNVSEEAVFALGVERCQKPL